MIRPFQSEDIESILEIWLKASVKAHAFIPSSFWADQLENMRNIYLPSASILIYEEETDKITGFIATQKNYLAALFVHPDNQGKGVGTALLNKVKEKSNTLKLSVYKENTPSVLFYKKQEFHIITEDQDEYTGHIEYKMEWRKDEKI